MSTAPKDSEQPLLREEPIEHTVESLAESYYAFQDKVLNIKVMLPRSSSIVVVHSQLISHTR